MTTDTVTDAQVFEAMGWEWLPGYYYDETMPPPSQWEQAHGKAWRKGGQTLRALPPVMSAPSSPEAWAAVPLMLEWFSDEILSGRLSHAGLGALDGTEWYFGVYAGPNYHTDRYEVIDGEILAHPIVVAAELPAAIGRALVEAKRG